MKHPPCSRYFINNFNSLNISFQKEGLGLLGQPPSRKHRKGSMSRIRELMTFGFETTFSIENWWQEPGFCSGWETPHKLDLMEKMAKGLVARLGGRYETTKDMYNAVAFNLYTESGELGFRVTSEPGSIEINTPPATLKGLPSIIDPLLDCAREVGLTTYRSWWYGTKSGTGGGCHLNMAGFTPETNPWKLDPLLVLKYFAYFHNRPYLHYPFMGPDVGKGGNCMRMDEQDESAASSIERFEEARKKVEAGWVPKTPDEIYEFFKGVPLREVKHSSPTLRKMKNPDYLVEDRAVEMLRTTDEFIALCEMRLRILEKLEAQSTIEPLALSGPSLHREDLSFGSLWRGFAEFCREYELDPKQYRGFFDRQFPLLELGTVKPKSFQIREGRRPRKVLGVNEAQGALVLSKKIDTRYKRFEFHLTDSRAKALRINGERFEKGPNGILIDLYVPFGNERPKPVLLDIEILDSESRTFERVIFDPNSMMTVDTKERTPLARELAHHSNETGFYSTDDRPEFAVWF